MKIAEWRCTIIFVLSTIFVFLTPPESSSWWQWTGSVAMYYMAVMWGLSAVYHRWYCHSAYDAPDWFINIGAALFMSTGVGTPRSWSAIHTGHHVYSDTNKDPHSPRHKPWRTFFHAPEAIFDKKVMKHISPRIQTKNQKWLTKHYTKLILCWIGFLCLLGYEFVYFIFLLPACMVGVGTSFSNNIPHIINLGQPFIKCNKVGDMPWFWGLLFTEGYHNTHHTKPWLWDYREDGKGFDMTATIISAVKI